MIENSLGNGPDNLGMLLGWTGNGPKNAREEFLGSLSGDAFVEVEP